MALNLANRAMSADPNPTVGCVIMDGSFVVGAGVTHMPPGDHAEIVAIKAMRHHFSKAGCPDKIPDVTLYTTLEPCCHHGRTPPCTDAILAMLNIRRVVVGCVDPNPLVSGKGIQQLRDAGLDVVVGILQAECLDSIKVFVDKMKVEDEPFVTTSINE